MGESRVKPDIAWSNGAYPPIFGGRHSLTMNYRWNGWRVMNGKLPSTLPAPRDPVPT
jgi:hypothetical protein